MLLLSFLLALPSRAVYALLLGARAQNPAVHKCPKIYTFNYAAFSCQSPVVFTKADGAIKTQSLPPIFGVLIRLQTWLPTHLTTWFTPCALPVAAHHIRENQHETHVIQRHARRRNARRDY